MKLTVDRLTDGFAVCEREDESFVRLPIDLLPAGTREGSVLTEHEDGSLSLDSVEEMQRRHLLYALQNALFADANDDDNYDDDYDEDDDGADV